MLCAGRLAMSSYSALAMKRGNRKYRNFMKLHCCSHCCSPRKMEFLIVHVSPLKCEILQSANETRKFPMSMCSCFFLSGIPFHPPLSGDPCLSRVSMSNLSQPNCLYQLIRLLSIYILPKLVPTHETDCLYPSCLYWLIS